jgi:hypothetical protein
MPPSHETAAWSCRTCPRSVVCANPTSTQAHRRMAHTDTHIHTQALNSNSGDDTIGAVQGKQGTSPRSTEICSRSAFFGKNDSRSPTWACRGCKQQAAGNKMNTKKRGQKRGSDTASATTHLCRRPELGAATSRSVAATASTHERQRAARTHARTHNRRHHGNARKSFTRACIGVTRDRHTTAHRTSCRCLEWPPKSPSSPAQPTQRTTARPAERPAATPCTHHARANHTKGLYNASVWYRASQHGKATAAPAPRRRDR